MLIKNSWYDLTSKKKDDLKEYIVKMLKNKN